MADPANSGKAMARPGGFPRDTTSEETGRDKKRALILLVDDEPAVLRTCARMLRHAGFDVHEARSGLVAKQLFQRHSYDSIVSDLAMPGMDGISLLKHVRAVDLDVPILLMTGAPSVDTAMEAVALGAFRYLAKPVSANDLCSAVDESVKLHRLARIKRDALQFLGSRVPLVADRAGLSIAFERALASLRLVYQPVVCVDERRIVAFEALLRVGEPALANPLALLDAATQLGRLDEIGRRVRRQGAAQLNDFPADVDLHINLHPDDLDDEKLYDPDAQLNKFAPRVVLEITEQQKLRNPERARKQVDKLREMGFRVAVDDLGAGHAGLSAMVTLNPEIIKLDMSLIRDVHLNDTQRRIVGRLVDLSRDLDLVLIAEGVETTAELDALVKLGCRRFQGYYFARPADNLVSAQDVFSRES